jgi:hypothetical protein
VLREARFAATQPQVKAKIRSPYDFSLRKQQSPSPGVMTYQRAHLILKQSSDSISFKPFIRVWELYGTTLQNSLIKKRINIYNINFGKSTGSSLLGSLSHPYKH